MCRAISSDPAHSNTEVTCAVNKRLDLTTTTTHVFGAAWICNYHYSQLENKGTHACNGNPMQTATSK